MAHLFFFEGFRIKVQTGIDATELSWKVNKSLLKTYLDSFKKFYWFNIFLSTSGLYF
jgi:hypothetical protein